MDDRSWMYQVSLTGLRIMDYCNGAEDLLITHYVIWKILVKPVLDVHIRGVKIKVSRSRYYYYASYTKKIMEKYLCWFEHGIPYIP
jgi:hypothetical protein